MFDIREINSKNTKTELLKIGFDSSYIHAAKDKFSYKNIKIYNLTCPQANILKQTALSLGADCATNKNVITCDIEKSDVILTGSISQLRKISEKLKFQPFKLKNLAEEIEEFISLQTQSKTKIAGILNLSKNSFSGDGIGDTETAFNRVKELFEDGADIIDIGAESTKPYSSAVPPEKQLERILPLLEKIKQSEILSKKIYSIDTRSSAVAEGCIRGLGAENIIINDVSGGDYDENMFSVVSKYDVPIIIQHSKGEPENMQDNPEYKDVIEEIYFNLKDKAEKAKEHGVNKIILDVGIGFGKTREHNLSLIKNIAEFKSLGYPVMIGISRKSFMGKDLDNETKDALTLALNYIAYENNIDYIRVHNVKLHKKLSEFI